MVTLTVSSLRLFNREPGWDGVTRAVVARCSLHQLHACLGERHKLGPLAAHCGLDTWHSGLCVPWSQLENTL